MSMQREAIYAALFAKLSALTAGGSPTFITAERRLRHWNDVPAEECPYLGMTQGPQAIQQQKGLPPKWTLGAKLYIYVKTNAQSDPTVVPATLLNPILDAVEAALAADDGANNALTLGGLVSSVRISGQIDTSEGFLGDTEVAEIPIEIVVPS